LHENLGPLPAYAQLFDFLAESEHQLLLDWVLAGPVRFQPAGVTKGTVDSEDRLDPQHRVALTSRKLGPLEPMLSERLLAALPKLMATTGTGGEPPASLELELAAHGDGAFFRPHRDIPVGPKRKPVSGSEHEDRVLSAVYYFHALPKGFSGGQLRLFRFGADGAAAEPEPANHVDLEPIRNSLVAFPSWAVHEVRPVSCPSGKFGDYRFSLNCWYCRTLGPASA
jgi:Rps23 Pro-64 3,4-dihydroxylase Tpa1-like proline 4-hydroxylase